MRIQDKNIAFVENGIPALENDLGCKWAPHQGTLGWGLGTFWYKGTALGDFVPHFLFEESSNDSYHASDYEIIHSSPSQGSIRFFGKDKKLDFSVTITLDADKHAFSIDFDFDPLHPVFHPLRLDVPYISAASRFVKYPYETSIMLGGTAAARWTFRPDRTRAPLLFGNLVREDGNCFVGVGYRLDSAFVQGRLEYDPVGSPNSALKIYSPFEGMARPIDLQCVTRLELARSEYHDSYNSPHHMNVVVAVAGTQFDCIRSYIALCKYDDSVEFVHSIKKSANALFSLYEKTPGYVPGKGYHQLIRFDTGNFDTTVPHGWYSKYIVTGPQLLLAEQLYNRWAQNKEDAWARQRAFEMADFALSMQEDCGAFTNWDTDVENISIMHPNDVEGTEFNRCIYSISDMSLGVTHWLSLYNAVLQTEGTDRGDWKEGLLKAASFMASLVGEDGELGRNYDLEGNYDKLTSGVTEALQAFECVASQFEIPVIAAARDRLEKWVYEHYIQSNNWCNGSVDGGAWQGGAWPPPHNNDLMGVFNYASYCSARYRATGEDRYLQMAKDAVAYIWTCVMPVEAEGFGLPTRTLVREQDFYSIYGILIRGNDSIECLPYLSKVTQDPFFMKFYQLIIQVQIAYQAFDQPYSGFHIGLECDNSGREPIDRYAEGNNGYITRFVPQFLKSVTDNTAYRYVGGKGWGLGADYHLTFEPDLGKQSPYVLCASSMVRNVIWDSKSRILDVFLYDTEGAAGKLEICCPAESMAQWVQTGDDSERIPAQTPALINNTIAIPYKHNQPSKLIRVGF